MTIPCYYSRFSCFMKSSVSFVCFCGSCCIKLLDINASEKNMIKMACFLSTSEVCKWIQIIWGGLGWRGVGREAAETPALCMRLWCSWLIVRKPCSLNFNNGDGFVLSHPHSCPDVSVTQRLISNKCLPAKQIAQDIYINL